MGNINPKSQSEATTSDDWLQTEKHAIEMRHHTLRQSQQKLLCSFIKQSTDTAQCEFIFNIVRKYFNLKDYRIDDTLFHTLRALDFRQLFGVKTEFTYQEKLQDIRGLVQRLEGLVFENRF